MRNLVKKIFGTKHTRDMKRLKPLLEQINGMESKYQAMSDDELKGQTSHLRDRYKSEVEQGKKSYDVLKDLLPEAFAITREASVRALGMRHFDVQIVGGIVLFEKKIAEKRANKNKEPITASLNN